MKRSMRARNRSTVRPAWRRRRPGSGAGHLVVRSRASRRADAGSYSGAPTAREKLEVARPSRSMGSTGGALQVPLLRQAGLPRNEDAAAADPSPTRRTGAHDGPRGPGRPGDDVLRSRCRCRGGSRRRACRRRWPLLPDADAEAAGGVPRRVSCIRPGSRSRELSHRERAALPPLRPRPSSVLPSQLGAHVSAARPSSSLEKRACSQGSRAARHDAGALPR